ncbi:PadR family transcriptional regulator [Candidatus Thorarchaeota archaeon]|nr:MAG: PadR family transcriptional regulator [Candidatus Thorarchaeota archaeon]
MRAMPKTDTDECEDLREPHSIPRGLLRFVVMRLLESNEMSGTDIMNTLHERNNGQWQPSPGSIYPILASLEEDNYIEPKPTGGRSKVYILTSAGKERLELMIKRHAKLKDKAQLGARLWISLLRPHERVKFLNSVIESNLQSLRDNLKYLTSEQKKKLADELDNHRQTISELTERLSKNE